MRKIVVADTAGFCFGVRRAVDIAGNALKSGSGIFMLGPIIHNKHVIKQMVDMGANIIEDLKDAKDGSSVIVRAHGLCKSGYDQMARRGITCIDATCPFVKKIHKIVEEYHNKGYIIIIIGDKDHPEVQGINGWCDNTALIFSNQNEVNQYFEMHPAGSNSNVCVVAQTTITRNIFNNCLSAINIWCTNPLVFDTICNATNDRQTEAENIAKNSDIMIIIGSPESSNTKKLYDICTDVCNKVYLVESAQDLPYGSIDDNCTIGVTAGASTPAFIIREVVNTMSDEKNITELTFAEEFEKSFKTLNSGDVVTGIVVGIAPNEVHVDLGTKSDGYIPISELSDDPLAKIESLVKVGDKIEAFVVRVNDVEGTIMLSKKKVDSIRGWKEIEKANEDGTVLSGKIVEAVKGGVIALVNGARVFVPASLAAERYTADLESLVGTNVRMKIIEINKQRRRVTGSIKVVIDEEKREKSKKIWDVIEKGKTFKGVVKSLTSYGAFVDIGGIDGMIHISELSWGRIRHPSEVLNIGDVIDVYVISADPETKKISLGYKKLEDNPWEKFKDSFKVDDVISCKIVKLMPFGAFAQIIPGIDGLIHISQISDKRISKPDETLSVGQMVTARITEIDLDNKKVSLTIKEVNGKETEPDSEGKEPKAEELPAAEESSEE